MVILCTVFLQEVGGHDFPQLPLKLLPIIIFLLQFFLFSFYMNLLGRLLITLSAVFFMSLICHMSVKSSRISYLIMYPRNFNSLITPRGYLVVTIFLKTFPCLNIPSVLFCASLCRPTFCRRRSSLHL